MHFIVKSSVNKVAISLYFVQTVSICKSVNNALIRKDRENVRISSELLLILDFLLTSISNVII